MKSKSKKILSVILSVVLAFSCLLPTFGLIASAESEADKIANLKAAWSAIEINPDVLFENWYSKTSGWQISSKVFNTQIDGKYWPYFVGSNAVEGLINKSNGDNGIGSTNNPIDIDNYSEVFFYYTLGESFNKIKLTSSDAEGESIGDGLSGQTLPATQNTNGWTKFNLKSLLNTNKSYFDGTVGYFMRIHFEGVPTTLQMTSVLGVNTFEREFGFNILNDTADWTLNDWLERAIKFDFASYVNGQAVIDLINEYYWSSDTNFTTCSYAEVYRTNTAGNTTLIPESEFSFADSKKLHDNILDNPVNIQRNNSTIDIVYSLPSIKGVNSVGISAKTKNIRGLSIYVSNVKDAVWQDKNLVYNYIQTDNDKLLTDISFTFEKETNLRFIRFSIDDTVSSTLDITEVFARGSFIEEKVYGNILNNKNNVFEISTSLQDTLTGEVTDIAFDANRFGNNGKRLYFTNINDGDENTVYDFMMGVKGKQSFNLVINLGQAYVIDNIYLGSGGSEKYYPTNMKYYVANNVDALFLDENSHLTSFSSAAADGKYNAEFKPLATQYVRIEIVDNNCDSYSIRESGVNSGEDYILSVINEISICGVKVNDLLNDDEYVPYVSEIRQSWGTLKNKPEVLLDTFWTKNGSDDWTNQIVESGTPVDIYEDNTKETVNTYRFTGTGPYLVHVPLETDDNGNITRNNFQNTDTNISFSDYNSIYFYARNDFSSDVSVQIIGTYHDGIPQSISLSNTWKKYHISDEVIARIKTGELGRIQIDSGVGISVSTVMGIPKMDFAAEFGTDIQNNIAENNWSLAQWIVAAAGVDFSKYEGGEYVTDALNEVFEDLPEYKALYDLAAVWKVTNKTNNIVSLDSVNGVTINSFAPDELNIAPYDFVETNTVNINKYTFTGRGANTTFLLKDDQSAYKSSLSGINKNNVVYLSYYIPETVGRNVYVNTTFEYSNGLSTTNNSTGNKLILPERGKWALLSSDDLKGTGYASVSNINKIECDMDANYGLAAILYLGPVIFAEASTLANVTGDKIEDYYAEAEKLDLDSGVYTNEAAFKTARDALKVALASNDCKISGDASLVYNDGGTLKSYYTVGNFSYTAFRVMAQYVCPNDENGNPILNQVMVGGKPYELISRGIILDRFTTDDTYEELSIDTLDQTKAKYKPISGSDLTQKWWSIENKGTTSVVTFSIVLQNVNKNNAETAQHTTRAALKYKDDNGAEKILYSEQVKHGTIYSIWKNVGTGVWFPTIDWDNKDNWDYRPLGNN